MQPEIFQKPSWPLYNTMPSAWGQVETQGGLQMDDHHFSFSFTNTGDFSVISSDQFLSTVFSDEFLKNPTSGDELRDILLLENIEDDMKENQSILNGEIEDLWGWYHENAGEGRFPSEQPSMEDKDIRSPTQSMKSSGPLVGFPSVPSPLTLPGDGTKIDNQLSIQHLLQAYGEAMEMEQVELTEVILKSITEKVSPVGKTLERLVFNLFQSSGKQWEYLKQESSKNFEAAFRTFYQIFPYGRFAHFTANMAILEAIPENTEIVHIVDFNTREGLQWPPVIEAVAKRQKALRLTSIKMGDDCDDDAPLYWRFEETKRRLCNHARSVGLNLKVEEMGIVDLVSEIKKIKKMGGQREWLAFNCMVGLLHMGNGRSRSHAMEFLTVAKEFLTNSATNRGIIVIGDGDAGQRLKHCSRYGSFFNMYLNHYQALCESMEWNFPVCLAEARISMESLFVAPFVSPLSWFQKWKEVGGNSNLHAGEGLKGLRLSKDNLKEAKEIVKEGESSYTIRVEGHKENEMVLEWKGTPLVRVSAWI